MAAVGLDPSPKSWSNPWCNLPKLPKIPVSSMDFGKIDQGYHGFFPTKQRVFLIFSTLGSQGTHLVNFHLGAIVVCATTQGEPEKQAVCDSQAPPKQIQRPVIYRYIYNHPGVDRIWIVKDIHVLVRSCFKSFLKCPSSIYSVSIITITRTCI